MIKWLLIPMFLLLALAGILVALPSPVDAVAYLPPVAPAMTGAYQPNDQLDAAEVFGQASVPGPEDVDVDSSGRLLGATADGKIVAVNPDGTVTTLAATGGRPLGLDWDAQGNLIICDAFKGLLSLSPAGELKTLLTAVDGIPLGFTDDLEIAADGMIYFSDASIKFDQKHWRLDLFESRPWGRLIRFDPNTGTATTLQKDLHFPNGVALARDGSYVLFNETYRYRVMRYWLQGPKQGQLEVFIDNLPGFPDGISSSSRGTFWVALPTTRNPQLDSMHPHPWLKNLVAKLPESLQPKPQPYGLVLELDRNGQVIRSLQDSDGNRYPFITSAQERDGVLYLGSLMSDGIGRLPVPQ